MISCRKMCKLASVQRRYYNKEGNRRMDFILSLLETVENFLWGIPMMVMLLGTGLYLTLRSGFFQVRKFPVIWNETVGSVFKRKKPLTKDGMLSPFESLSTALASTVGTGNMAGVATARSSSSH